MEEAMSKFESLVGSAEGKLDNIEKRIDEEFGKHLDFEFEEEDGEDRASLLKKLEEVKTEYASVCREAAEVSVTQREMAKVFQQELMKQVHQLQALQDRENGDPKKLDTETETAINSIVK